MTVRTVRWGTECEDCDILALFGSDFADDFAKALDKMGWMIIRQPVEHEPAERQLPGMGKQRFAFFRGTEVGNRAAS